MAVLNTVVVVNVKCRQAAAHSLYKGRCAHAVYGSVSNVQKPRKAVAVQSVNKRAKVLGVAAITARAYKVFDSDLNAALSAIGSEGREKLNVFFKIVTTRRLRVHNHKGCAKLSCSPYGANKTRKVGFIIIIVTLLKGRKGGMGLVKAYTAFLGNFAEGCHSILPAVVI